MLATATDYLLALATLGEETNNRNVPISAVLPKVTKASSHETVDVAVAGVNVLNFANGNTAL
jgi:hypothetical protein